MNWTLPRPSAKLTLFLLLSSHIAGLLGIGIPIHPDFVYLTPFNLLLSCWLVLSWHPEPSRLFWYFCAYCFAGAFLIEFTGVNTGLIFGHYHYGDVLGPKLGGTPWLIGVNWLMLGYAAASCIEAGMPNAPALIKTLAASACMTLLDFLIEPFAIRYGLWAWDLGDIPLQNYLAWFLSAIFLLHPLFEFKLARANRFGMLLFGLQVVFFLLIRLFWR